jgi:DNA-binding CsgD family transcriptional regulator
MAGSGVRPELAGAIYDCVFRPELWPELLGRIQREVGAASSYLIIHDTDPRSPEMTVLVQHNVDHRMRHLYDQHYVRLNPLLPYLGSVRDGDVYSCRHLVVRPEYLRSEFYQTWAAPQEWFDYAGVTLIRESSTSAAVGFTRSGSGNIFDDSSLDLIRRLAPHLTRAAELQRMIERERQSRRDLAALIEATRYAFLILDSGLRVLQANAAAEALLARQDGLSYRRTSLWADGASSALEAAVRAACRRDTTGPVGTTLAVPRGPGRRPLILQVVPFEGREAVATFSGLNPATAAVFVIDPEKAPGGAMDIFTAIHQLTGAERQVLERLAGGDSPAEIAAALGVGMATIRTHLHRLFDKTGTSRQSELLMLLNGFTPPIRSQ